MVSTGIRGFKLIFTKSHFSTTASLNGLHKYNHAWLHRLDWKCLGGSTEDLIQGLVAHKNDVVGRLWAASIGFDTCALDHDMYLTLMKDRILTRHINM